MIIRFEERKGTHSTTLWAINESPDNEGEEEGDGDGPVGDQTEYGSSGQRFRHLMMRRLFDSPHTSAVSREG
jgi:hypothetical protein